MVEKHTLTASFKGCVWRKACIRPGAKGVQAVPGVVPFMRRNKIFPFFSVPQITTAAVSTASLQTAGFF